MNGFYLLLNSIALGTISRSCLKKTKLCFTRIAFNNVLLFINQSVPVIKRITQGHPFLSSYALSIISIIFHQRSKLLLNQY